MSEKSLQININSVDDAHAVIQHLQKIKDAFHAHGCDSVEFVMAEEVVTPSHKVLVGAINWCTTFRKIVKPIGGNILFQLPHYQRPVPAPRPISAPAHREDSAALPSTSRPLIPPRPFRGKKSPASPAPLVQVPLDGG